jgi:quercetin dioxygenase-like cupin family protein
MAFKKKYQSLSLGGYLYKFHAKGEDTGGAYTFFEAFVPPRDIGPPPHVHRNEDVAFYIIDGLFTFSLDGVEFKAKTGDFVFLPRGLTHWKRNESDSVGKMLVISNPPGFEKYFDRAGTLVEDDTEMPPTPTNEELIRLVQEAPNFGIEMFL